MTYNDAVSQIQGSLNTLNKDMYIPRRLILSKLKANAKFLMSQKFNDKSLFRETNIFRWCRCIELEEIDAVKCGRIELQKCSTAMMSVEKLPDPIWSRYGASVLMVTNITDEKEYTVITPSKYITLSKTRGFEKFKGGYAIIHPDGKISIPDSTVKRINILIYTLDECTECKQDCDEKDSECKSHWDFEFIVSDKMEKAIIAETFNELMPRVQIPSDANPQGDPNIKSREQ